MMQIRKEITLFFSYNFFPLTFHLPSEYPIFFEEFKRQSSNGDTKTVWIMKPVIITKYLRLVNRKERAYFFSIKFNKFHNGRILCVIILIILKLKHILYKSILEILYYLVERNLI
jgi:hypothetical protein